MTLESNSVKVRLNETDLWTALEGEYPGIKEDTHEITNIKVKRSESGKEVELSIRVKKDEST